MRKLLALVIVVFIAGCSGGIVRPRVEKGIEDALPSRLGPAKEYKVRADGETMDMLNGLIRRLRIDGTEVQIHPSLTLKRLEVDLDEVRYNNSREVTDIKKTTFKAVVTDKEVNRYIYKERVSEHDLEVKLTQGKVGVTFIPSILGFNILVSLTGEPKITGRDKVNFVADKGSVARVPVPAFIVNKVLDAMNPIVDMSLMGFPVSLEGINIRRSEFEISGSANFSPEMLSAGQTR